MKIIFFIIILFNSVLAIGQIDLTKPFSDCNISGSITLYDYKNQRLAFSDSVDAKVAMLPASTFKIINLLIALETKVIKDENEVVNWVGGIDTVLYGYRPNIYRDMTVKEAFDQSAGWVFIELAKRIGKDNYIEYLKKCNYGNNNLSQNGDDFWNIGDFAVSPINQIEFMRSVYEESGPFAKRNYEILKRVMINEESENHVLRAKTGWANPLETDIGWWVGYVERADNVYFFVTRITKLKKTKNPNFGNCRIEITKAIISEMNIIE